MSRRTVYTSVTPLPASISREIVQETLRDHKLMIDLNPLVKDRYETRPPPQASAEESQCVWYEIKDKVSYLPGVSGEVTYSACFHDLPDGLQTHVYAPLGLDIKEKWSLGGSLPGELRGPTELGLGIPKEGLYLREDIDMRCNFMLTSFVKGNLKRAHTTLVERMIERSHLREREEHNQRLLHESDGNASPSLNTTRSSHGSFSGSSPHQRASITGFQPPHLQHPAELSGDSRAVRPVELQ